MTTTTDIYDPSTDPDPTRGEPVPRTPTARIDDVIDSLDLAVGDTVDGEPAPVSAAEVARARASAEVLRAQLREQAAQVAGWVNTDPRAAKEVGA